MLKINTVVLGGDFEPLSCRRAEEWVEEMYLKEGGGVLLRPDQHILETWREIPAAEEIFNALAEHLGLRHESEYPGRK